MFFQMLLAFVFLAENLSAEQLPLKLFTSADGLASSAVTHIAKDSRGFLWFSTRDGLSRFDGREFVNFRINDQPNATTFWNLLETRDGFYWISTSEGLYRVNPNQLTEVKPDNSGDRQGEALKLNAEKIANISPIALFEDSKNRLWGGAGNFYLIAENGQINIQNINLGKAANGNRQGPNAVSITETADGSLWIACIAGVARRLPDGKIIFYSISNLSDYDGSQTIRADETGRIWVVYSSGLYIFYPERSAEFANVPDFTVQKLGLKEQNLESSGKAEFPEKSGTMLRLIRANLQSKASQNSVINGVFQSSDGKIWISADEDLFIFEGENYRRLRDTNGFPAWTGKIVEDANNDLWIGTSGVLKLSRNGLTSYGAVDGLEKALVQRILEGTDGTLYILHAVDWRISRITENGIETAKLKLPELARMLWTSNAGLLDERGDWWALAESGLYRFTGKPDLMQLNNQNPSKIYGKKDGLKADSIYCAFTDSQGNLWFSTRGRTEWSGLSRYDPKTETFYTFTKEDGYPETQSPVSFAEDKDGNLWFGIYGRGLLRYKNGRFTDFSKAENLPQGSIFGLYVDGKNRLWIGSSRDGIARVDQPSAEKLEFVKYTTGEGLISNNIRTLTGDLGGNIYAGTVRGISRISPETGNIRHFTTADGLAADFVTSSFRDKNGTLWFGTTDGVSKLEPEAERKSNAAPQVWVSGLEIAGNRYTVSEFGQKEIGKIEVGADKNNLQIEFLSVGSNLRFQYKLEGAENTDWSSPTSERRVNFANLAPDSYRFLVRAVNESGQASENPASVNFTINPPFYRTWWFYIFAALIAAGSIFALDRYRVSKTRQIQTAYNELQRSEKEKREAELALQKSREERLAELERVRTRIATDLHDDIGSSLTQIAVLSQAAHSRILGNNEKPGSPFERISAVSIELVNAMSDIVWAINPRKDNVRDLVQRMRRFAADVFTAKGIKFDFAAPDIESKLQLGANIRREVFAIYKESVNNVVKHSGAERAEISLKITGDILQLQISDNGRGFDLEEMIHSSQPPATDGGNGLINIQRRGVELGGKCEIISFPEGGTTVLLEIPLYQEQDIATRTAGENGNKKA